MTLLDRIRGLGSFLVTVIVTALLLPGALGAQEDDFVDPAPDRERGEGPFERLIIRGATLIDGSGAPAHGPVDIVIEGNRIVEVEGVGAPGVSIDEADRPGGATREIDAHGSYVLPGFVDIHIHTGGPEKTPNAEYMYKLWMGHGITTIRGVPFGPLEWSLSEKARSSRNEIAAPRMYSCHRPGSGEDWERQIATPEVAREWVQWLAKQEVDGAGADCLKLGAHRPAVMEALIDEAENQNYGTVAHLGQTGVARMNALDAARVGLDAMTHYYGLFEALYKDHDVQPWPLDHNHSNEQHRFAQVARQWDKIHEQGSKEWNALIEDFLDLDFILDPTMTAYLASRDVMRARTADWHDEYTLPSLWEFYRASRTAHGSYYYDWTTRDEAEWKRFYDRWMAFLDDYKDAGGRVTVSSDAGFIYNLFGFSTIEEMELLQEAGFHPLEVFRGATLHGAEAIFDPKGEPIQFGEVREGLLADLVIVDENPVHNLKVLYGTGHRLLNDESGEVERVGGVKYTIKDGILFDARQLRADVREMVEGQKQEWGISSLEEVGSRGG